EALPNLFMIYATPQGKTSLARLEEALRGEVASLRAKPVDHEALDRARKRRRAAVIGTLKTNLGLASALAPAAQNSGDPWDLERRLRQLEQVTPEDLQEFATKYLVDTNLTMGTMAPPKGAKSKTAPAAGNGEGEKR